MLNKLCPGLFPLQRFRIHQSLGALNRIVSAYLPGVALSATRDATCNPSQVQRLVSSLIRSSTHCNKLETQLLNQSNSICPLRVSLPGRSYIYWFSLIKKYEVKKKWCIKCHVISYSAFFLELKQWFVYHALQFWWLRDGLYNPRQRRYHHPITRSNSPSSILLNPVANIAGSILQFKIIDSLEMSCSKLWWFWSVGRPWTDPVLSVNAQTMQGHPRIPSFSYPHSMHVLLCVNIISAIIMQARGFVTIITACFFSLFAFSFSL